MLPTTLPEHPTRHAAGLASSVKRFAVPDRGRSLRQLGVNTVMLVILWIGMLLSMKLGYWLTLLLAVPTAGFVVRFFMIQHDCGHASFFRSPRWNNIVGHAIGALTLTPYGYWKQQHAEHHATSGNLDRRGVGDVTTLTVREYLARSWWRRLSYRFYRHPLVMLGIGPTFIFLIKHRLPLDLPLHKVGAWLSVMATNASIAGCFAGLALLVGPISFLKVQLPIALLASSIGVWMFFIQHQFEGTYWRRQGEWRAEDAALRGSSYYRLPRLLRWFTASIGLHHIHHLCSRIPNYRLQECLEHTPEMAQAKPVTIMDSLRYTSLALWDEAERKMVKFRDLRDGR